ncbi:MAG: sterol desaturase family protein [Deltaproteobacteria bacterium]|nr:sterol desaturase family protein [Deltaproteobacteria bacterium]
MNRAVELLFFPVVLGAALVAGEAVVTRGGQPAVVLLASALVVLVAERLWPHLSSWQRSHRDVAVDLAHVVSVTAASFATLQLVPPLLAPLAAALAPLGTAQLWPNSWPLLAQLPLALVVAELFQYWSHRLSHEWAPLWRLHATHHSAPRLYFLNAARFHPLDIVVDTTAGLIPLVALGCPAPVQALFALFTSVFGYLQHSNVRLSLGPLNYVFSMAELHRWHHAKDLREANTNYGSNLILWDLVFGTFFWPRDRKPPEEIGIPNLGAFPQTYWAQLASPFRWRAIENASRS